MALTELVIMPGADYQAICDAVRAKTGGTALLKSGDLSPAIEGIQAGSAEKILYMDAALLNAGGAYPADADDYTTAVIPAEATFVSLDVFDKLPNIDTVIINGDCELEVHSYHDVNKTQHFDTALTVSALPLKKVVIKDRTAVPNYLLCRCGTNAEIEIENCGGVGQYAFFNAKTRSVTLKNVTGTIDRYAFYGCTNLTAFVIPEGVTAINDYAFYFCSNLGKITIPASVTAITSSGTGPVIPISTVIRGYAGSYAETFAKNNHYTFEVIE